jgi:predicted HTH domain antitoxin
VHPNPEAVCCPYAQGPADALRPAPGGSAGPLRVSAAALISHWYNCQGLSTYEIAKLVGISRQRVGRLLTKAGVPVKPRGAGRQRRLDAEQEVLTDLAVRLYLRSSLTSGQISALIGIPERTIRDRLRARGVRMRTRGRANREDRAAVPTEALSQLYVAAGLSAAETGRRLGVHGRVILRSAHDQGLPVRIGGPEPRNGPSEIELIDALYADPLVHQALSRHDIAPRPAGGPVWQRFPVPVHVGPELAKELYVACGLGLRHIELVSGQPAETVRALLHAHGIGLRPPGGRSPFMRRWRREKSTGGTVHPSCWPPGR